MSLYQKYRPKTFDEMIGNKEKFLSLKKLLDKEDHPHTFLFVGKSGTGKTTLARICANYLGVNSLDIYEINTSNNRGIDTARDVIERMSCNTFSGRPRVFIIDEVHNTTKDWQNAMLKPLEDTGKLNYFFLCTTNPEKLLKTIKNRCYEFVLEDMDETSGYLLLKKTARKEGKTLSKQVMDVIIEKAEGSYRKSLLLLEKILFVDSEEEQIKLLKEGIDEEEEKAVIDLCRLLVKRPKWREVSSLLRSLRKEQPEKIRNIVLSYMSSVLLNKPDDYIANIIFNFSEPFYNYASLVLACYNAVFGK